MNIIHAGYVALEATHNIIISNCKNKATNRQNNNLNPNTIFIFPSYNNELI